MKTVDGRPIKYDLKKPCKDCPFLVTSELHKGIGKTIVESAGLMDRDSFAHSCHKTDPRSDSPEGHAYKGPAQHCAGAIALMAQGTFVLQSHVVDNVSKEQFWALKETKNTWRSMLHLAKTYLTWANAGCPPGKTGEDYDT